MWVGAIGPNTTVELADDALKMSLTRRDNPRGCIHHSDHGILSSMVSISSPWDNAAMVSPMGPVKSEGVHARVYATRDEAVLGLFEYIEVIYNRARIHTVLGNLSPAEFEEANWPDDEGRPKAT